ncbi:MAG: glycerophosphodiester phosphodiesterase [Planctomycetes bacterium]|nr:glycerophosphodiester phosphodiesterase [Planctomycetota bacterium]
MRTLPLAAILFTLSCAAPGRPPGKPQVIAHRGGTGPDGTIAGCRLTLDRGVFFLELDVRLTRDGRAVILHDATVDRTTDGSGAVAQMTLEEVKRLDAGIKWGPAHAEERIPTVAELLHAVGPRATVLLELKVAAAAGPVIDAIREEQAFGRAVVRTADPEILRQIRGREPRARTGTMAALPAAGELDAFVSRLAALRVSAFTPLKNDGLTRPFVQRLQSAGIAVWGTNTNEEAVWRRLIDAGVDGIITDRPDELLSFQPR